MEYRGLGVDRIHEISMKEGPAVLQSNMKYGSAYIFLVPPDPPLTIPMLFAENVLNIIF